MAMISARSAGIEDCVRVDLHAVGLLAHHPRRSGDLSDGFAFHPQSRQKRSDLQRRGLADHDLVHHGNHFRFGKIDSVDHFFDRRAYGHAVRSD